VKAAAASEVSTANRDSVPVERIAATCSVMTKPAPMIAAMICATRRVRLGPISRNSITVIAIATAAADKPLAMTTPKAESHLMPPPMTSTSIKGVDSNKAMPVTDSAIAAIRTENTLVSCTGDDMIRSRSARA
jgi:hypothetical protein